MKKIEVGMLVRIVDGPDFKNPDVRAHIGKTAIVNRPCPVHPYEDEWELSGLERNPLTGNTMSFSTSNLRPIKDDDQASWNNEVWKKLGWNPTKQTVKLWDE